MNKSELVAKISESADLTKAQAQAALDALTATVTDQLAKGEQVVLVGFGTFSTKARSAREGRNPQTGEAIKIAAATLPAFKAGSALKKAVSK